MKPAALLCSSLLGLMSAQFSLAAGPRTPVPADYFEMIAVADPQVSPDGDWVAYTVGRTNLEKDESSSSIWMVSWDGTKTLQLTQDSASASSPRWSPDGHHLAFVRAPAGDEDASSQIWLLDRRGGEAQQLTDLDGELSDFVWSPDSKRLAVVLQEEEEQDRRNIGAGDAPAKAEKLRPWVINRYQFKSDGEGYHTDVERPRILLFEIATRSLAALTDVNTFAEHSPAWSPDGARIAFVSNRDEDWDRTENNDVWVAEARAGAPPRKLTSFNGSDDAPLSWSPDGRHIAFLQGSEPRYWQYNYSQLAIVPADGGPVRLPTTQLDRDIGEPQFTPDGRFIDFLVTDDRRQHLARVATSGGEVRRLTSGDRVIRQHSRGMRGAERIAVASSTRNSPPAIYALERGQLRQLTHHNDAWAAALRFGTTEDIEFPGRDGVSVHGLLTKPADWEAGGKYPTLLWIHGGPYAQDEHAFDFEPQLFAGNGYVVLQINYRGSSGRGTAFGRGIFADWGNRDLKDLLAGIDHLIAAGIADPDRLGVGGWSQGGVLTNFVISNDPRFKAAISGAGNANQFGMYGHDQYVYMYDLEFGQPWSNRDLWIRLSYPFFNADKIQTPTLFVGGEKDFNVPIHGSEQMYQALQSLKVPTQLVIYPGEHHGIDRPSFYRDLMDRYLAWFSKYLGTAATSPP
jgi:dipeptidyl aminopeptidase/acylaminoacyl peptidase